MLLKRGHCADLGWGPTVCISNPDDADAAGPGTTLSEAKGELSS